MFDVFYIGNKPNLFPHEREASSIAEAQELSRTRFCWVVTYLADYTGWDWFWEPAPWQNNQCHAWPSQWQKDSGTYLVPKTEFADINYHTAPVIPRRADIQLWQLPDNIDPDSFDFSWHPDPTEPSYEYHFGTQWQSTGGPVYPGTAGVKIIDQPRAQALPDRSKWQIPDNIDPNSFDFSWHPDLRDTDYEYHFGTQWQPTGGPVYPGTAGVKIIDQPRAQSLPDQSKWQIPSNIDITGFDFSWHPDLRDTDYEYHFGTQWQSTGGPVYPGTAGIKIVDQPRAQALPDRSKWQIPSNIDPDSFDFSWHPDPTEPGYEYHFGTQWQLAGGPVYPGTAGIKLVEWPRAVSKADQSKWQIPSNIDTNSFDFSWHPDPTEPSYEYHFGTQWQPTGGPVYPGTAGIKLVEWPRAVSKADQSKWQIPSNIDITSFDFSWHPDLRDADYEYHFGTQWQPTGGPVYPGTAGVKIIDQPRARALPDQSKWQIPSNIDITSFDFSWHPDRYDLDYEYHFGTQWQPTGGPVYPGTAGVKIIDQPRARALPDQSKWQIPSNIDPDSFDFSWHPDLRDIDYEYHFGTQWQPTGGPVYPGTAGVKIVDQLQARALPDQSKWQIPSNIDPDSFDFSWHPDLRDTDYEYHFGTQWQSTGGPVYAGTAGIKLVEWPRAISKADRSKWQIPDSVDPDSFDFSWHPDLRDTDYEYHFGTQWQPTGGPIYPGTAGIKIVDQPRAQALPNRSNWQIPDNIDPDSFDFSWHPNLYDLDYEYHFGTQWQSTGGPVYPGTAGVKIVDQPRALHREDRSKWQIPDNIDPDSFDFSWHPDPTEPSYEYHFGTQWQPTGGPVYPGTAGVKIVDQPRAQALPNRSNWKIPSSIDPDSFDFSWHPDLYDLDYEYHFGTQWQPTGGPIYPGTAGVKIVDQPRALHREDRSKWQIPDNIDPDSFDFSWHPDLRDTDYEYHFGTQWQPTGGPVYPGTAGIKIVDQPKALHLPDRSCWQIHEDIDTETWDWSWHPNPLDPPMTYVWGNQWVPAVDRASISYVMPGATETVYQEQPRTCRLPQPQRFETLLPVESFDYSWEPNPRDPPMTYVWGNQWNPSVLESTIIYRNGSTNIKYMDHPVARIAADMTHWQVLDDIETFDFSWRPDPTDPAYRYVFGNQWLTPEQRPSVCYTMPGATESKYMTHPRAQRRARPELFVIHHACEFDFSWEPDPGSPPYIYVFGNQWWPAIKMPTVEYHMPGATERKYMTEPQARLLEQHDDRWHVLEECDWDYSWCPDPGDPPYIYVFGNQWWPAIKMPTVEYHMPGATERKYMDHPQARLKPKMEYWVMSDTIDIDNVDFSWRPDPGDPAYIYHFGSQYQQSAGLTYIVPGAIEVKFVEEIPLLDGNKSAVVTADIFYMDRSGAHSRRRFERLQQRYPTIQRIRWVNSTLDTIRRCCSRTENSRFWVISSDNVYDNFDFEWNPETWQSGMTHVFGSRWNKWSDTFMINRREFDRHSRWVRDIEEFPNLNFVSDQSITVPQDQLSVHVIDHGDYSHLPDSLTISTNHITRFYQSYLETFRRMLVDIQDDYIWVISTICDYQDFDFGWRPDPWQREMLHVFPSGSQKFGDTFYVPVAALRRCIEGLERLEWFETVNFCNDQVVQRRPFPVIEHKQDSHVDQVKLNQFVGPAAIFTNCIDEEPPQIFRDAINLWAPDTRAVVSLDPGNQRIIVPRETAVYVRTQIYDYPHIDLEQRALANQPLDVVFISNGEQQADDNYRRLRWAVERADTNRIVRVDGITGRVAAYHAAAQASQTAWFFAVFAKLEVFQGFDWRWQPDRMQQSKHYIFHARNPVNGLVYGHQAMIAYNRDLVLANPGHGLDFTLDQAHEVVPILSGTAYYAVTPWQAWRTAFREAIKLRYSLPDVENEYRLQKWLKCTDQGTNSDWSAWGAQDAMEYYDAVEGNFDQLRKSYEWTWLASYALLKRNLTADQ